MRFQSLLILGGTCAAVVAFSPPAAHGADRVIASLSARTKLSAWDGRVVFSRQDPATHRWRLVVADAGGPRTLSVPSGPTVFDADAGPDAEGHPGAVYSRCASDPVSDGTSTDRHCTVAQVRLDQIGAHERRLRAYPRPSSAPLFPTIWKGRLAFSQTPTHSDVSMLWIQRTRGSTSLRRIPRGTVPKKPLDGFLIGDVAGMDLGPHSLAFTWEYVGAPTYGHSQTQMVLVHLPSRRRSILDGGFVGECYHDGTNSFYSPESPTVGPETVTFLALSGPCGINRARFVTIAATTSRDQIWEQDDPLALTLARDHDTYY